MQKLGILNIWVLPRVVVVLRLDRAGRADRQQPQVVVHRKVLSNALRAGHVHHLIYSLFQINVVFLINPLQPISRLEIAVKEIFIVANELE